MAKLTGALLSFGARGTIGKAVTFSAWRGVNYARQRVVGANPKTAAQTLTRAIFAMLREVWKRGDTLMRAPWDSFAQGRPFVGSNAFVGENVRVLRGEVDLALMIGSPGSKGGLGAASVVAAGGVASGSVDVTIVPPTLPTGWTVTRCVALGIPDQAPENDFVGPIVTGEDAVAPYVINLAGFTGGSTVACMGWIEYLKPNGETAYSPSITDLQAATV